MGMEPVNALRDEMDSQRFLKRCPALLNLHPIVEPGFDPSSPDRLPRRLLDIDERIHARRLPSRTFQCNVARTGKNRVCRAGENFFGSLPASEAISERMAPSPGRELEQIEHHGHGAPFVGEGVGQRQGIPLSSCKAPPGKAFSMDDATSIADPQPWPSPG